NGDNPPFGATVDYRLRAVPKKPVTLEILDGSGALVRRYSSDDKAPAVDLGKIRMAPQWVERPATLSAAPGTHRFVWPLRHAAPVALADDVWTDGPWAAPGKYRLVLTVDGERLEQRLEVVPDPRVALPQSAYDEQLALARAVDALRVQLAVAAKE